MSEEKTTKRKVKQFILLQMALLQEILRVATRYTKMMFFSQRDSIINVFKENQQPEKEQPKVLAAVAHITSLEESNNPEKGAEKIERLRHTIDGLLTSFAHCDLTITIQTLPNRHVTAYLPEYQIKCIQIQEDPECDPMFVGFRLQE
jgi:hemoglobin-like flavoprotein